MRVFYYENEKKNIFSFFDTKNFLVHVVRGQFSEKSWKKFKKKFQKKEHHTPNKKCQPVDCEQNKKLICECGKKCDITKCNSNTPILDDGCQCERKCKNIKNCRNRQFCQNKCIFLNPSVRKEGYL